MVCCTIDLSRTTAAHRFFLFSRIIGCDIVAIISIIALRTILLRLLGTAALIVAVIVVGIVLVIATIVTAIVSTRFFAGDSLFFTARDGIGVHPKIMIGKLMVIFGLDAVAVDLGVLRHFLEFIQHLYGIAARAIVNPVIAIRSAAAVALGAVVIIGVPAAPTAARLTIVHQISGILIPLINLVFLKS